MDFKKGKILISGSVVIDTIFGQESFGGTGANIAYGLALLGVNPMLFSLVGKDFKKNFGKHLKENGVDVRVYVDKKSETANFSVMKNPQGKDVGTWHPNAYKNIHKISFLKTIKKSELKDVSIAIFSPGTPESTVKHMIEFRIFYSDGLIIFDPGQMVAFYSKKQLVECIKMADIFILNEMEYKQAKNILKEDSLVLIKDLNKVMIKTQGEKGSVIFEDGEKTKIKAIIPKKVLDTTGAGDAYRAGLIFGLWQGKSITEACMLGAEISSKNVEFVGCQQYKI